MLYNLQRTTITLRGRDENWWPKRLYTANPV